MATFDLHEFYSVCSEIEYRLGILRANECVREWWKQCQQQWQSTPGMAFSGASALGWISSTTDPGYDVTFEYNMVPLGKDDAAQGDIYQQLHNAAAAVWADGQGWAAGISGYLEDMCAPFTKPEASTMSDTISSMGAIRSRLHDVVPSNWTGLDVSGWEGQAHLQYQNFIKELHESMQQYDDALTRAENWFNAAATLASQAQNGVLPFVKKVNDVLDGQLREWAATFGSPGTIGGGPSPLVMNLIKVGDDILSWVPAYETVKDNVEKVVGDTQDIFALFGKDPSLDLGSGFTLHSATEIYQGLANALYDKHLTPFKNHLDKIASTSSSPAVADIAELGSSWFPPMIPADPNISWQPQGD